MKKEKGKKAWKMESQNLSRGWNPNCQCLVNTNGNGRCAIPVHFLSYRTDQVSQLQLETTIFIAYVACRRSPTFSPVTLRKFRNPRLLRIDHEIVAGNNEKWAAGRVESPAGSSSLDVSAAGTGVA